jgi:hypothetical protein
MASVVVAGYMIRHPVAGNLFAYFHYLYGLHRLGHQVVYVEESGWPGSCYDPLRQCYSDDPQAGMSRVRKLCERYGVDIPVCYVRRDTGESFGVGYPELEALLSGADLLLNLGGVCALPEFQRVARRAFVDMDPLFTQAGRFAAGDLENYHVYFSYGTNIGRAGCTVPTRGVTWLPAVPPVAPEIWADGSSDALPDDGAAERPFTTIANWHAYGGLELAGEHYGQKDEEFLRLLDLPQSAPQPLELALSGAGDEVKRRLAAAGWRLRDAGEVSLDVDRYRGYVAGSRGEFSVAKQAYVRTRSGWFSDRSVCYLAAGRPVVLQDTGIDDWLPRGQGVHLFASAEQALQCLAAVDADYAAQRRAASCVARELFGYQRVLPELLERAFGARGRMCAVGQGGAPR